LNVDRIRAAGAMKELGRQTMYGIWERDICENGHFACPDAARFADFIGGESCRAVEQGRELSGSWHLRCGP
jgi:hypothetical protein